MADFRGIEDDKVRDAFAQLCEPGSGQRWIGSGSDLRFGAGLMWLGRSALLGECLEELSARGSFYSKVFETGRSETGRKNFVCHALSSAALPHRSKSYQDFVEGLKLWQEVE